MARRTSPAGSEVGERWSRLSGKPTTRSMLLNAGPEAEEIDREERREILSILPPFEGRCVLELGAGIGRFTRYFVESAERVVAVDFVDAFVAENRKTNGGHGNAEFICADIRGLGFPAHGFDLIFTNWLLAYLDDDEIPPFLDDARRWLAPDGHLFVRESCHHSAIEGHVDTPRDYQAIIESSHYRHPDCYRAFFADRFRVAGHGRLATYIRRYGNDNQFYWLLRPPHTAR